MWGNDEMGIKVLWKSKTIFFSIKLLNTFYKQTVTNKTV